MTERGSVDQIIENNETFNLWVNSYVSELKEYLPEKVKSEYTLKLKECPWDEAPKSLQDKMKLQYDAANLDGEKTIDTMFFEDEVISFSLNSPHVIHGRDSYGETDTTFGLILWLSPNEIRRGRWAITKQPTSILVELERLMREGNRLGMKLDKALDAVVNEARHRVIRFPASLEELRDVANFFQNSRQRAVLLN